MARERLKGIDNVDFQVADMTSWDYPMERFDYVASIATLHHLPIPETLQKMAPKQQPENPQQRVARRYPLAL